MSKFTLPALALAVMSVISGCSTPAFQVGHDFDPTLFATQVVRGKTTEADVKNWLGAPSGTGITIETDGQRYTEWTYYFADGRYSDLSDTRLKTLRIKFDQAGHAQGYAWSKS